MSWTLAMLVAGLVMVGIARWQESRPHQLGEVRLFPATMVLALGLVLTVMALAHLASLLIGVPLQTRSSV